MVHRDRARAGKVESAVSARDLWGPEQQKASTRGISVALDYTNQVKPEEELVVEFVIAGTDAGEDSARSSFAEVVRNAEKLYSAKSERYDRLLACSALSDLPEKQILAAWDWMKCNYDWLARTVPGIGSSSCTGLGAGFPEYVWWFGCDSAYALRGCLALGQHELAVRTIDLIRELSIRWNGNSGRVIHEANTRGCVYNPGNSQETPHFITIVHETFKWTGDIEFLRRNYDFCRRGILDWTIGTLCRGGDLLPYGFGIIEVEDLDLQIIDTAVHTARALEAVAAMADVMGDAATAAKCRDLAPKVKARIEEAFWMPDENMYGDIVATPAEMIPRLRKWIAQAQAKPEVVQQLQIILKAAETAPDQERKRAWNLKNWVIITPAEFGIAPPARAHSLLSRIQSPEYSGPWGLYLSGIDHENTMSISTGAAAVAEGQYGRVDEAVTYMKHIADTLSLQMPGAISEMSPDYGCFVQAWSGYGIPWSVVTQIFGARPDAANKKLEMKPMFPFGWTGVKLTGVRVGPTNSFSFCWDGSKLQVTSAEPGWTVVVV